MRHHADDGVGGRFTDALQRGAARRGGEHRSATRASICDEGHLDAGSADEHAEIIATKAEVAKLKQAGTTVTALELDAAVAKDPALGDSPNQFFNVYRPYWSRAASPTRCARSLGENPDVFKLEQIGTSTLGKPILVLKMTENARNVKDGTRDAILFSAVNHAREWIAAEMGRRLPGWFAAHKNDPKIRELIQTRELWFLPIQNPDGYDYTFTCGVGISTDPAKSLAKPCDYRKAPNTQSTTINRFWRKTLRDNNANGVYGDSPARTAWTRTATTRPSAGSTKRARPTASAARPTAARTRCPSPRTWPSTASSGA